MAFTRRLAAMALAAALLLPQAAVAGSPAVITERDRTIAGTRAILVALAQTEIETSIDIGRIPTLPANGLLDAIIIASTDDRRKIIGRGLAEKAEAAARPLRAVLTGFDADALALAATQSAFGKITWFAPGKIESAKVVSKKDQARFLASTDTEQVAIASWRYGLSPDFTQIRVIADLTVAKSGPKGSAGSTLYRQTITSIAQLAKRSYDHADNVAAWADDDARRARTAITAGFGEVERLIPYALSLSATDAAALTAKNAEKAFGAGLYGSLVRRDADGSVLIWSDGFVRVTTQP
jgi:hypothetical protein